MNVGELRTAFEALIQDSVDNTTFLTWIIEAQEEIALEYGKINTITIECTTVGEAYSLPSDFLAVAELLDSNDNRYYNYDITSINTIIFEDTDIYTLYYHKSPDTITANDDNAEPEIHPLLHSPMIYYAAAQFYDQESGGDEEESNMATKMLNKFYGMVHNRSKKLKARRSTNYNFSQNENYFNNIKTSRNTV